MKQKRNWSQGETVKVGFMSLIVVRWETSHWILKSKKGVVYHFEPYNGLYKVGSE